MNTEPIITIIDTDDDSEHGYLWTTCSRCGHGEAWPVHQPRRHPVVVATGTASPEMFPALDSLRVTIPPVRPSS